MRRTLSIPIGLVVIIGIVAGTWYLRLPQTQYRMRRDYDSFYRVAMSKLKPGLSYREVTAVLGPGEPVTGGNRERELTQAAEVPRLYPDGLLPSDTIMSYPTGKFAYVHLYFRDGVLINFDLKQYPRPARFSSQSTGPQSTETR